MADGAEVVGVKGPDYWARFCKCRPLFGMGGGF